MRSIVGVEFLRVCTELGVLCPLPPGLDDEEFESAHDAFVSCSGEKPPLTLTVSPTGDIAQIKRRVNRGVDAIIVEAAHVASDRAVGFVRELSAECPQCLIGAGNFMDSESALPFVEAGATLIKIGFGWGSICTSSQLTGVGRPQLATTADFIRRFTDSEIAVVVDGGFRWPGDAIKALALGASATMSGFLFAGHSEATFDQADGHRAYAGNHYSSLEAGSDDAQPFRVEGRTIQVTQKGPLKEILGVLYRTVALAYQLNSAVNARQLHERARFARGALPMPPQDVVTLRANHWFDDFPANR